MRPVITQTLRTLSNVRVRNVATVGGSLAHADPHMDLPPVLIALGAHVVVAGRAGERTIPVEELFAGYYETVLARDELITERDRAGARRAGARPISNARRARCMTGRRSASRCRSSATDDAIRDARIVVSAATETPTRLAGAEAALRGGGIERRAVAPGRRCGGRRGRD